MSSLIERVAKSMYEAPYDEEPASVWPPRHPVDLAWWMSRAQIAVDTIKELQS